MRDMDRFVVRIFRGWLLACMLPAALAAQRTRIEPEPASTGQESSSSVSPLGSARALGGLRSEGPGFVLGNRKISNAHGGFPDTLDPGDGFGASATPLGDLDGDGVGDLAVGASGDQHGTPDRGAVWILFLRADGTVREAKRINSIEGGFTGALAPDDIFGTGVAGLGDVDGDGVSDLAVGVFDSSFDRTDHGPWILFLKKDGTVKSQVKISTQSGGFTGPVAAGDAFGSEVGALGDLDGDGVVDLSVGAEQSAGRGAVWTLLLNSDGTVKAQAKITAGANAGDSFGAALVGLGDVDGDGVSDLGVGAPGNDDGGSNIGAFWVIFLNADGTANFWREISATSGAFLHPTGQGHQQLGRAIGAPGDLDGDGVADIFVGANIQLGGMVWQILLTSAGTVKEQRDIRYYPTITPAGNSSALFGSSVAPLGDLDGDGLLEIVAGDPHDNAVGNGSGALWMLSLAADATVEEVERISGASPALQGTLDFFDEFGTAMAFLGDLDGDGTGDMAVGAKWSEEPSNTLGATLGDTGNVWILFLEPDGSVGSYEEISASKSGLPLEHLELFGSAIAALGDVDGDGTRDLAVGSERGDSFSPGRLWILFLRPDGTVRGYQQISSPLGPSFLEHFGCSLAAPGDLDEDGVVDLFAGIYGRDEGSDEGAVYLLYLNSDGTLKDYRYISRASAGLPGTMQFFGQSLAVPGDIDGDGILDLVVGEPRDSDNGSQHGALWVLFLNADGSVRGHRKTNSNENGIDALFENGSQIGDALAPAGDIDGDGVPDLAVGDAAPLSASTLGKAWIVLLRRDGSIKRARPIGVGLGGFTGMLLPNDQFGTSIAYIPGSDGDSDGVADLIIGAPDDSDFGIEKGAVWLLRLDGVGVIDFEHEDHLPPSALVNGEDLGSSGAFGRAVAVEGLGANLGPVVFDSQPDGPNQTSADPDLLVGQGNVLVLQDSNAPWQSLPGIYDFPGDDDEGGMLGFSFLQPVEARSLDLVDIDLDPGACATVTLLDSAGESRVYTVSAGWTGDGQASGVPSYRTLDLRTMQEQPGVASTATVYQSGGFDPASVVRIEVQLGTSGAIDNLRWDPYPDALPGKPGSRLLPR